MHLGRRQAYDLLACHAKGDLSSTVRTSIDSLRETPIRAPLHALLRGSARDQVAFAPALTRADRGCTAGNVPPRPEGAPPARGYSISRRVRGLRQFRLQQRAVRDVPLPLEDDAARGGGGRAHGRSPSAALRAAKPYYRAPFQPFIGSRVEKGVGGHLKRTPAPIVTRLF